MAVAIDSGVAVGVGVAGSTVSGALVVSSPLHAVTSRTRPMATVNDRTNERDALHPPKMCDTYSILLWTGSWKAAK